MKFVYLLAFVTLAYSATVFAADCDPDSNGQPECNASNEGAISRNFFDPTHYWQCKDNVAVSVRCPDVTGFLASAGECVPWSEWKWTAPCPDVRP
ncbi:uncharacterized protein LOC101462034 [Ceratitis capitata]|uniref:uncharacterized protein LOC101462034 n=1 Tax=Ceratitis capitata TaxID=7213 RepID=UPI000329FADB|nr:uncharacterized protein LOC101462034 [Ceratitis capitata]